MDKSSSAFDYLKDCAIHGRFPPGRHLAPTRLADQLRVSITPVRDALARLTHEGFFVWRASQGYFTKPFTVAEQRGLFQLIRLSILLCLDFGDPVVVTRQLERFVALPEDPRVTGEGVPEADSAAFTRMIEGLYLDIAEATGNMALHAQVKNHLERTHLVRRLEMRDPDNRRWRAVSESRAACAVLRRDLPDAIDETKAQLTDMTKRLPTLVALANSMALQAEFP